MNHYLDQIEQLVELQKVDDLIHAVKSRLKTAPEQIQALQEVFASVEARKAHIEEKLQHLSEQEKRVNNELEENAIRMKKSKAKLAQVETEREFNAATREVDNSIENQNRLRTDEQQALKDEISLQNGYLEEVNEEWASLQERIKVAEEDLAKIQKEADVELAKFEIKRNEVSVHISAPILSRYEFIRRRLEHPVIVSVQAGVCSGCNIAIPPQTYNELQRAQQILSCPNCQRLIFWGDYFRKDEEE